MFDLDTLIFAALGLAPGLWLLHILYGELKALWHDWRGGK